jgi:hypothetical protein
MSQKLVDEILALPSHLACAEWLITCPDWDFIGWVASIRRALELAHFPEAVVFLERRLASLQTKRLPDGGLPQTSLMAVHGSRGAMLEAARKRDGAQNG